MSSFYFASGFEILFALSFLLILGAFAVILFRNLFQWSKNNRSPQLTVKAKVVAKRQHYSHSGDGMSSTRYYVTFEVESGDRMELSTTGQQFGLLSEGDDGELTFQGTRYLEFRRSSIGGIEKE